MTLSASHLRAWSTAFRKIQFDGVSFASTFNDAKAAEVKHTQYFEVMGSRAIYHDGWIASAFGPRIPWVAGLPPGIKEWTPDKDKWELYDLSKDWTQADDLAGNMPAKVADMKDLFLIEFTKNKGLPIGGGLWIPVLHPELRLVPPYTSWTFPGAITRMPEVAAPALGNKENLVSMDVDVPANANGVLYALGGFSGGLALYVKDGVLSYEYNLFEIMRTHIKAKDKLPAGKVKIEVADDLRRAQASRSSQGGAESQWQRSRVGRGAGQRPTDLYGQRLPRLRHRSRLSGRDRVLRSGPLQIQRHDRRCARAIPDGAPAQLQQEKLQTHGAIPSQD